MSENVYDASNFGINIGKKFIFEQELINKSDIFEAELNEPRSFLTLFKNTEYLI